MGEPVTIKAKMIKKDVILIDCLYKEQIVHSLMHNEWRIKGQPSEKGTLPTRKARSPRPDMKTTRVVRMGASFVLGRRQGMKKASERRLAD